MGGKEILYPFIIYEWIYIYVYMYIYIHTHYNDNRYREYKNSKQKIRINRSQLMEIGVYTNGVWYTFING